MNEPRRMTRIDEKSAPKIHDYFANIVLSFSNESPNCINTLTKVLLEIYEALNGRDTRVRNIGAVCVSIQTKIDTEDRLMESFWKRAEEAGGIVACRINHFRRQFEECRKECLGQADVDRTSRTLHKHDEAFNTAWKNLVRRTERGEFPDGRKKKSGEPVSMDANERKTAHAILKKITDLRARIIQKTALCEEGAKTVCALLSILVPRKN